MSSHTHNLLRSVSDFVMAKHRMEVGVHHLTPLHCAGMFGNLQRICAASTMFYNDKFLEMNDIKRGFDPDEVVGGYVDTMKLLLKAGANPNAR